MQNIPKSASLICSSISVHRYSLQCLISCMRGMGTAAASITYSLHKRCMYPITVAPSQQRLTFYLCAWAFLTSYPATMLLKVKGTFTVPLKRDKAPVRTTGYVCELELKSESDDGFKNGSVVQMIKLLNVLTHITAALQHLFSKRRKIFGPFSLCCLFPETRSWKKGEVGWISSRFICPHPKSSDAFYCCPLVFTRHL